MLPRPCKDKTDTTLLLLFAEIVQVLFFVLPWLLRTLVLSISLDCYLLYIGVLVVEREVNEEHDSGFSLVCVSQILIPT